ncbi:hypothetical protein SDC9_170848 [bioreactor metagenome]|uniref:Phage XkdN-like protein n=1 Tax=bioreactor metagenome TaxID=1076179 RepID=A0A645GBN5_9ZZZZ
MDTLELLLKMNIPDMPEKEIKVKRLSTLCGEPVVFRLRALPYSRTAEIIKDQKDDMNVHILLAGVLSPDLKSKDLMEKYHTATPAELVKRMLLPGEIEDISRAVEKLSGFRMNTIEEVDEVKKR